jgi:hypothetical protein
MGLWAKKDLERLKTQTIQLKLIVENNRLFHFNECTDPSPSYMKLVLTESESR